MTLPILSQREGGKQTQLTEYDIKLFEPSQERFQKIKMLSKTQKTNLSIDVVHLQNQIRATT